MTIEELCQDIERRRQEALKRRISAYPRHNPIASDLGPCGREYVLAMTKWQERPLPDVELKARFERGTLIEDAVLRELSALGITVRTEQTPFEIKDKKGRIVLRGKVDGFITVERQVYPVEVKSLDPNIFRQIHTAEDFDKYPWAAKYPRQLQAYLYAHNLEAGFFLLDDCKGAWRLLPVALDYAEMEEILQRCEAAVMHREAGTLPEYHQDPSVCRRCWAFGRLCDPPVEYHGLTLTDDPEVEEMLDHRAEIEPAHREYEALDKTLKEKFQGRDGLLIGKWLIQGKEITQQRKAQEARTFTFWQTKITKASDL